MPCKVCGATPEAAEFYTSIATYCKRHWRERVKQNRESKLDYYRAYDKVRANRPDRVERRRQYAKTEDGREAHARARRSYRDRHPLRARAHVYLGNAVRDGKVQPWPVCSLADCHETKVEGHHTSYDDPLGVVWLCGKHHKETHALFSRLIAEERAER